MADAAPAAAAAPAAMPPALPPSDYTLVPETLCVRATGVKVLAGALLPGYQNGVGENKLNFPQHICQPDENTLLIADRSNGRIRQLNLTTMELSTLIGCGEMDYEKKDGLEPVPALAAHLFSPSGVCMDPSQPDTVLLGVDDYQRCIRRYSNKDATINIVAGQVENFEPQEEDEAILHEAFLKACLAGHVKGEDALFSDVAVLLPARLKGSDKELVYVSCMATHIVRSFDPSTHEVKRVCGNGRSGPAEDGSLEDPFGLAVDSQGRLLIACLEGYTILRFDPSLPEAQQLERIAGQSAQRWFRDGKGKGEALLGDVAGLATDPFDTIYFCDYAHGAVRAISPDGYVYTLVCADSQYTPVCFSFAAPFGLHFDRFAFERGEPRLFVTDFHRVLEISLDFDSFPRHGHPGRLKIVSPMGLLPGPTEKRLKDQEAGMDDANAAAAAAAAAAAMAAAKLAKKTPSMANRMSKGGSRSSRVSRAGGAGGVRTKKAIGAGSEGQSSVPAPSPEDEAAQRTSMSSCLLM